MTRLVDRSPATLALALAAGIGVLAFLAAVMPSVVSVPENAMPSAPPLRMVGLPAIDGRPFQEYATIADRPLFNAGRKKDNLPQSQAAAGNLPALSEYRLVGIVISKQSGLALIERRATKQVLSVHIGDSVGGRRVDQISAAGVDLSGPSGAERLAIPRAGAQPWSFGAAVTPGTATRP